MTDVVFYQGDEQPFMQPQLLRGDSPIDLTAATGVSFKMYRRDHEAYEAPVASGACVIVKADEGRVKYPFGPSDLDIAGRMSVAFVIDWNGKPETVPDTGYIGVTVVGAAA